MLFLVGFVKFSGYYIGSNFYNESTDVEEVKKIAEKKREAQVERGGSSRT